MPDKDDTQGAEYPHNTTDGDAAPSTWGTIQGGAMSRKIETMPDGRYIIYYSWDEDE